MLKSNTINVVHSLLSGHCTPTKGLVPEAHDLAPETVCGMEALNIPAALPLLCCLT